MVAEWTRDSISTGPKAFPSTAHAPVLIHPTAESPDRYVVKAILLHPRILMSGSETQTSIEHRIGDFAVVDVAARAECRKLPAFGRFFGDSRELEMR